MKNYDSTEVPFSNDFMFCTVLYENLDLAKELVELITQRKVREIKHSNKQLTLDYALNAKAVRLDVYFEDEDAVYDLEMQTGNHQDLAQRARYYQGSIDQGILDKGGNYINLKNSYIIFICTFDPFNLGKSLYTFQTRCTEDPSLILEDKATKIFLNSTSTQKDVSKELQDLLKYIDTGITNTNDLVKKIDEVVVSTRRQDTWRGRYMTLEFEAQRRARTEHKDLIVARQKAEEETKRIKEKMAQMEKEKNEEMMQLKNENKEVIETAITALIDKGLTEQEAIACFENAKPQ